MATNTNIFKEVNESIINDIKNELRLQGHYLTGALEESIEEREIAENGGVTLTAKAAAYIESLEKGIDAKDIKINSQSLAEMTRYVELRMGYKGGKAMKVALLILQKQKEEGNPTFNSMQYSKTGRRREALKETFEKNQSRYSSMIDNTVVGQLDNQFHQIKSGTI